MKCQCADSRQPDGCVNETDIYFRLCVECDERGCKVKPPRRAEVTSPTTPEVVGSYLPRNYHVRIESKRLLIEGYDDHGWTLDGYVIPRLGSGLIAAREIK